MEKVEVREPPVAQHRVLMTIPRLRSDAHVTSLSKSDHYVSGCRVISEVT